MTNNEMLVLLPSRGRPEKTKNFYELFKRNSVASDICFGLDEDDYDSYAPEENVIYSINKNMRLCPKLNVMANQFVDKYKYICFIGDDVQINTYGWDAQLLEPLKTQIGISYGNDHYHGEWLPNTFVVNSEIIKALGWFVPPVLNHFYMDNFYKDLGTELGILHYFPDVNLEHRHHTVGKSELDETYKIPGGLEEDEIRYNRYKELDFQSDVNKIRSLISESN
jgi:hypothetical protein